MIRRPPRSTLSLHDALPILAVFVVGFLLIWRTVNSPFGEVLKAIRENEPRAISLGYKVELYKDRKSTRLNSSHANISYAVFCLKKKTIIKKQITIRQSSHYT